MAFLVFVLLAVNIIAFVYLKKAGVTNGVKNVWLYELPPTASPLDSYSEAEFGPQNGVIGTLGHMGEKWDWNAKTKTLTIQLAGGVLFSDMTEFSPTYWIKSREWVRSKIPTGSSDPYWDVYLKADVFWRSPRLVEYHWTSVPKTFSPDYFMKHTLSNPLTGIIHPTNLLALQQGKKVTKDWISSGPYRVLSWNSKEIVLTSRDDYPLTIPKPFSRTIKYQANPDKKLTTSKPGAGGDTFNTLFLEPDSEEKK